MDYNLGQIGDMGDYTRYPGLRRSSRFRAWLLLPLEPGFYFRTRTIPSFSFGRALGARRGLPHGQERERPPRAVELRPPLDHESACLIEADGRGILLVHVNRQLAFELPGMPHETPA